MGKAGILAGGGLYTCIMGRRYTARLPIELISSEGVRLASTISRRSKPIATIFWPKRSFRASLILVISSRAKY